ncbi:MAG: UDP-N-acetylmuramoyl-L-alanyl-D-glutamate--2,6-diaminopimelate ligase [Dermatophilaceae bacterium]
MAPTPLRPRRTPGVTLAETADLLGVRCPEPAAAVLLTGVSLDSRTVLPGDLYAALPGQHAHGADFAAAALTAGAVAILTDPDGERRLLASGALGGTVPLLVGTDPRRMLGEIAALVYDHPADALQLIGITGTNGKTTTAYLVESALRAAGRQTGLIGTVETRAGTTVLRSVRTTPEATDLMAILAVMREAGVQTVVMEVSSHALAQHRVGGLRYDVAGFTNLSQDHLDFHADMAEYFDAKASLFTPEHAVTAVVCVDDDWGRRLAARASVPVTTLRTQDEGTAAQQPGDDELLIVPGPWPTFDLVGQSLTLNLRSALPGAFNVTNTALAAGLLLAAGLTPDEVGIGLLTDPHVPGRMERVDTPGTGAPRVVVDYAHTPEAVRAALVALRDTTPGRLVVVLGAGGDRDRAKRAAMGAEAARGADLVVVTDDNPRGEDPAVIRAALLAGARHGSAAAAVTEVGSRAAAIAEAVSRAGPDDTVLVLGKGHERGQEIAGVVHPFDDVEACRAALAGTPYRPGEQP